MGNTSSEGSQVPQKKDASFINNLQLYEEIVTQEFGHVKVFKSNEKPFRYYMLYRETGINQQKTRLRLQQKMCWYLNIKQHKNIITIEYVDLQPSQDMCIQKINLDLYSRYYNYTLDMAVASKLKRFLKFRERDLAYILVSLLSVGKNVHQIIGGQASGWFTTKNIYITPQGHIKIYPFPLYCELKSANGIHRSIQSPHKHTKSLLQNEQIVLNLSRKTSDGNNSSTLTVSKRSSDKDDIRDIGLVIFQLLVLNRESIEVKLYSNEKIMSTLNLLVKQGHISTQFKDIVGRVICNYRQVKYQQVMTAIQQLQDTKVLQISNCIKLDEGMSIIQSTIYQKKQNLKQLSQHKQLKAGCISIVSPQKNRKPHKQ